jgi:hypothetical protein
MGYLEVDDTMEQTFGTGAGRRRGSRRDAFVLGLTLRSFAALRAAQDDGAFFNCDD